MEAVAAVTVAVTVVAGLYCRQSSRMEKATSSVLW